jgi:hypothetical protein
MFNMASDSGLFCSASECDQAGASLDGNVYRHPDGRVWLPLYEGKMVHHFDHRWAGVRPDGHFAEILNTAKTQHGLLPLPRYWVQSSQVHDRLPNARDWLLGFREICRSTDERSIIASVFPHSAVGDTLPLLLSDVVPTKSVLLAACLSSFSFDYVVRQKIGGTHLNFFIFEQLPVLPPDTFDQPTSWSPELAVADWLTPRVLELTYTAWDLARFARDLGYDGPPFMWAEERRSFLRAELDACFFHLYGIERDDVAYIMDTFPIVRRKDEAAYGEYRTARLILERYDEMAKAIESGTPYRGVLD